MLIKVVPYARKKAHRPVKSQAFENLDVPVEKDADELSTVAQVVSEIDETLVPSMSISSQGLEASPSCRGGEESAVKEVDADEVIGDVLEDVAGFLGNGKSTEEQAADDNTL